MLPSGQKSSVPGTRVLLLICALLFVGAAFIPYTTRAGDTSI